MNKGSNPIKKIFNNLILSQNSLQGNLSTICHRPQVINIIKLLYQTNCLLLHIFCTYNNTRSFTMRESIYAKYHNRIALHNM